MLSNEEFFYDILAPQLILTGDKDSQSEIDAIIQGWILEIGRRRIAKLLKKASNLSFKEAFSNLSDSIDYIVLPELRKIQFINPPSSIKSGDRVQLKVIGLDQARDTLDIQNQIIWSTTSGKISSQGVFIVNDDIDHVIITATVKKNNIQAIEAKIKIRVKANLKENYYEIAQTDILDKSIEFTAKSSTIKSQSNSSDFPSFNTNSSDENSNLSTNSSFKLYDNLPVSEAPLYSTRNNISLSVPSWFYKSQAFHDGFFAGDLSYDEYLEYMSNKDYYSYSR